VVKICGSIVDISRLAWYSINAKTLRKLINGL